jgi:hypothetical protein
MLHEAAFLGLEKTFQPSFFAISFKLLNDEIGKTTSHLTSKYFL